jgi:isopenicillin-N epimerase
MKRNHDLCVEAREMLCSSLGAEPPCPPEMIASMATLPLPLPDVSTPPDYKSFDLLQERLYADYGIEIPVWYWDDPPCRLTRISVQLYNSADQFSYLLSALRSVVG